MLLGEQIVVILSLCSFMHLKNGSYHVFLFLYQIVKLDIEINIGYQHLMQIKNYN